MYADLASSTKLVDGHTQKFAAEVYKSFLLCAARVIRDEGGEITAYDGDRIMAVFIGDSKNTSAATSALKINYCVREIVNPLLQRQYPQDVYEVRHVVGIDTSPIMVARTGIRGANDLVWVGRAANYAAKLSSLSDVYPSQITADVYDRLNASAKFGSNGGAMWERSTWPEMNHMTIYRSTWYWKVT